MFKIGETNFFINWGNRCLMGYLFKESAAAYNLMFCFSVSTAVFFDYDKDGRLDSIYLIIQLTYDLIMDRKMEFVFKKRSWGRGDKNCLGMNEIIFFY